MIKVNKVYNIECIKGMQLIQDKSIDCIICVERIKNRNKLNG